MKEFVKNTDYSDKKNQTYSVVSLFSGCGGKDRGVIGGFTSMNQYYGKNNFKIIYANDISPNACITYEHNFKEKAVCADISTIPSESFPAADIVIGGFPCQDFSVAGNRKGFDSDRGQLYLQMKRVIEHLKPKAFLAENVEGLTNLNGDETVKQIVLDFEKSGYKVNYHLFNASDYGVPQSRKRVIFIGIREDLYKGTIPFPTPTHSEEGEEDNKWLTSFQAIDDIWDKIGKNVVPNHTEKDYSRARFYQGRKMQGNNQIKPDRPAPTIRAEHHGNIEAHYRSVDGSIGNPDVSTWRRLSVRECARIQTFPDDFVFPKSASSAYKEIGNAVPPIFAWHLFRRLSDYLDKIL